MLLEGWVRELFPLNPLQSTQAYRVSLVLSVYSLWFQILFSDNEHTNQSDLHCYINLTGHKNVLAAPTF